jgi:hypothetical protein
VGAEDAQGSGEGGGGIAGQGGEPFDGEAVEDEFAGPPVIGAAGVGADGGVDLAEMCGDGLQVPLVVVGEPGDGRDSS